MRSVFFERGVVTGRANTRRTSEMMVFGQPTVADRVCRTLIAARSDNTLARSRKAQRGASERRC